MLTASGYGLSLALEELHRVKEATPDLHAALVARCQRPRDRQPAGMPPLPHADHIDPFDQTTGELLARVSNSVAVGRDVIPAA